MNTTLVLTPALATGTTFQELASQYNTTPAAILAVNPNLKIDFDLTQMGSSIPQNQSPSVSGYNNPSIIIPGLINMTDSTFPYNVQRGDTITSIAQNLAVPIEIVEAATNGLYPNAFSLTQALPARMVLQIQNLEVPGALQNPLPVNVTTPPVTVEQIFYPSDTLAGLAALLGVSIYDLVNANISFAPSFVTPQGSINANTQIGDTGLIVYPNVMYPGFVSSETVSPAVLTLAGAAPESLALTVTANPYLMYGLIAGGIAVVAGAFLYFKSKHSKKELPQLPAA